MITTTQIAPKIGLKVVTQSANRKIGFAAGTYRIVGPSCPSNCAFLLGEVFDDDGNPVDCYATNGFVRKHNRESINDRDTLGKLNGAPFVRHEISGDSYKETADGRKVLDRDYVRTKLDYHRRNKHSIGWGYTHNFKPWDLAQLGPKSWPANFVTLASCDNEETKAAAIAAGWRTARVIQNPGERHKDEVLCPYDLAKYRGKNPVEMGINCTSCQKCLPGQNYNIAFLPL